jgi:hypothetical protein
MRVVQGREEGEAAEVAGVEEGKKGMDARRKKVQHEITWFHWLALGQALNGLSSF